MRRVSHQAIGFQHADLLGKCNFLASRHCRYTPKGDRDSDLQANRYLDCRGDAGHSESLQITRLKPTIRYRTQVKGGLSTPRFFSRRADLTNMAPSPVSPVKMIDFLLVGHSQSSPAKASSVPGSAATRGFVKAARFAEGVPMVFATLTPRSLHGVL